MRNYYINVIRRHLFGCSCWYICGCVGTRAGSNVIGGVKCGRSLPWESCCSVCHCVGDLQCRKLVWTQTTHAPEYPKFRTVCTMNYKLGHLCRTSSLQHGEFRDSVCVLGCRSIAGGQTEIRWADDGFTLWGLRGEVYVCVLLLMSSPSVS